VAAWAGSAEVAFVVDDVDAYAKRLAALGTRVLSGPADRAWGHRTLHVADPDGTVVDPHRRFRAAAAG
jgi:lactoylglutathione lyase